MGPRVHTQKEQSNTRRPPAPLVFLMASLTFHQGLGAISIGAMFMPTNCAAPICEWGTTEGLRGQTFGIPGIPHQDLSWNNKTTL